MKTRVAILCGGLSGEHQVSLISAFNIARALPRDHYEFQLIGIRKDGSWQFKQDFPDATGFPYVIIDGEKVGGLVETAKLFLQKGIVSSRKK